MRGELHQVSELRGGMPRGCDRGGGGGWNRALRARGRPGAAKMRRHVLTGSLQVAEPMLMHGSKYEEVRCCRAVSGQEKPGNDDIYSLEPRFNFSIIKQHQ